MPDEFGVAESIKETARDQFTNERRVSSLADEVFEPEMRERVDIEASRDVVEVEPTEFLGDDFDQFKESADQFSTFRKEPGGGRNVAVPSDIEDDLPPDPAEVHQERSAEARQTDERLEAPLTDDPLEYAKNPDEFDWPGVDTPPGTDASQARSVSSIRDLF